MWVYLFVVFAVLFPAAQAQQRQLKMRVSVQAAIESASNEESIVLSNLKRELRALQDVDIVDEKEAQYDLSVVAIKMKNRADADIGYAVSVITFEYLSRPEKEMLIEAGPSAYRESLEARYALTGSVEQHRLLIIGDSGLSDLCKEIVADFDVKILEPHRRAVRAITNRKK